MSRSRRSSLSIGTSSASASSTMVLCVGGAPSVTALAVGAVGWVMVAGGRAVLGMGASGWAGVAGDWFSLVMAGAQSGVPQRVPSWLSSSV